MRAEAAPTGERRASGAAALSSRGERRSVPVPRTTAKPMKGMSMCEKVLHVTVIIICTLLAGLGTYGAIFSGN